MKEFTVIVYYEGAVNYVIKADTEDDAKDIAMEMFEYENSHTLAECIENVYIADAYES